jgi:hypothetical protein
MDAPKFALSKVPRLHHLARLGRSFAERRLAFVGIADRGLERQWIGRWWPLHQPALVTGSLDDFGA